MKLLQRYSISVILTVMVLSGCSTKKEVARDRTNMNYAAMSVAERLSSLAQSYGQWDELNVPLKVEIASPMNVSVSGRAYLKRDRYVYVSLRFLGMEVINLYVDNDSVFVTDKMNKAYLAEGVGDVFKGVRLQDMQDVLLGRLFVPGREMFSISDFVASADGPTWNLTAKKEIHNMLYGFRMNRDENCPEMLWFKYGDRELHLDYALPTETDFGAVMNSDRIVSKLGNQTVDLTLRWQFDKAKTEIDNLPARKIPSGYKRILPEQLIKLSSVL